MNVPSTESDFSSNEQAQFADSCSLKGALGERTSHRHHGSRNWPEIMILLGRRSAFYCGATHFTAEELAYFSHFEEHCCYKTSSVGQTDL